MTVYINTDINMIFYQCWACGIPFALTEQFVKVLTREHKGFYCPKGCHLGFGQSEEDKLKKQLSAERAKHDQTKASRDSAREECETLERSRNAVRGHLTRVKNRVGNGVCPCCNRTFKNLARHMNSKHPGYKNERA